MSFFVSIFVSFFVSIFVSFFVSFFVSDNGETEERVNPAGEEQRINKPSSLRV